MGLEMVTSSARHWRAALLPGRLACSAKHNRAAVDVSEGGN